MATSLDAVQWVHGAPDCSQSTDPLLQVHQFDADTFIMRLSKCFSFEGNFMYLLFGSGRAILLDTGAPPDDGSQGQALPLRETVDRIIGRRAGQPPGGVELIVAHTHSHDDHVFWDRQFTDRDRTIIVGHALEDVKEFFNLTHWPDGESTLDLGGRPLTILPLPGHEATHIAVYDPRTRILLTGDSLYPGKLTVRNWPDFRRSAARLAAFADQHPISLVLGNHIEMKKTPRELYPIGTTFQPDEHALPLTAAHIAELHAACEAMGASPHWDVHDDFIIAPLGSNHA